MACPAGLSALHRLPHTALPPGSSDFAVYPELPQAISVQPWPEFFGIEAFQRGAPLRSSRHQYGLGYVGQCIHENVGMRGYYQLGVFGRRYEQFRQVGERIRVQPQLRFFDSDQRGRIGMTEDRQQTEIAQRAVRKPRGRYGVIALVQEYLNRAPLNVKAEIIDTRVQLLQGCKNPFLDLELTAEVAEHQGEVVRIG